jgi:hypothetical protein
VNPKVILIPELCGLSGSFEDKPQLKGIMFLEFDG